MTGPRGDLAPDFGGLGRKVDQKPAAPPPSKRAQDPAPAFGIKVGADGKWETVLPTPPTKGNP